MSSTKRKTYEEWLSELAKANPEESSSCLTAEILSKVPKDKVLLDTKGTRYSRRSGLPSHVPPTWPFVEALEATMSKQSPSGDKRTKGGEGLIRAINPRRRPTSESRVDSPPRSPEPSSPAMPDGSCSFDLPDRPSPQGLAGVSPVHARDEDDDVASDESEVQSALRAHPVDLTKPLTLSEIAGLKRMLDADHGDDDAFSHDDAKEGEFTHQGHQGISKEVFRHPGAATSSGEEGSSAHSFAFPEVLPPAVARFADMPLKPLPGVLMNTGHTQKEGSSELSSIEGPEQAASCQILKLGSEELRTEAEMQSQLSKPPGTGPLEEESWIHHRLLEEGGDHVQPGMMSAAASAGQLFLAVTDTAQMQGNSQMQSSHKASPQMQMPAHMQSPAKDRHQLQTSVRTVKSTQPRPQVTAHTFSDFNRGNLTSDLDAWRLGSPQSGANSSHRPLVFNPHHPLHPQQPWESPSASTTGAGSPPGSCGGGLVQNRLAAYEGTPPYRSATAASPMQATAGEGQCSRGRSPTKRQLFPQNNGANTGSSLAAAEKAIPASAETAKIGVAVAVTREAKQPRSSPIALQGVQEQDQGSGPKAARQMSPCPASPASPAAVFAQSSPGMASLAAFAMLGSAGKRCADALRSSFQAASTKREGASSGVSSPSKVSKSPQRYAGSPERLKHGSASAEARPTREAIADRGARETERGVLGKQKVTAAHIADRVTAEVVSRQLIVWALCLLVAVTVVLFLPSIRSMTQPLTAAANHDTSPLTQRSQTAGAAPVFANDYTSLAWSSSWPGLSEGLPLRQLWADLQSRVSAVWRAPKL